MRGNDGGDEGRRGGGGNSGERKGLRIVGRRERGRQ